MKNYIIKKTDALTPNQQEQLNNLINECDGYEPYMDCGLPVFLALEEDSKDLIGYLSYVCTKGGKNKEIEVTALVTPKYRNHGIFTALLSELKNYEKAAAYLMASVEKNNHTFYKGFACSEYLMEYDGKTAEQNVLKKNGFDNIESCFSDDYSDFFLYYVDADEPCAVCSLDFNDSFTSIYGVYVDEDIRGKGVGTWFINELIDGYFKVNSKPLVLNVNSTNTAAVKLYQKCGFIIKSKVDYFYL